LAANAKLWAACMAMLLTGAAHAGAAPDLRKLDGELNAVFAQGAMPLASLSVLAVRNGRVVYEKQFGSRVIDTGDPSKSRPADAQTLYRIASVSKLVATIGAMRLVEQGRLQLDADISRYLGFKVRNPNFPEVPITTRMLLNHTSSLRDEAGYRFGLEIKLQSVLTPDGANYGNGSQWAKPDADSSNKDSRAPGQYFEYVNLNWGVLGTVMEAVSGQRFDRYMKQAVLDPLRIAGGYNPEEFSAAEINNTATLYRKQTEAGWNVAGPWVPQVDDYQGKVPAKRAGIESYVPGGNAIPFSPQGGLRISVRDLGKLMRLLMNGGAVDRVRLLRRESVQTMLTEQWRFDAAAKNGDTQDGLFQAWCLGTQRFIDRSIPATSGVNAQGDRFVEKGGVMAYGHLGDAYGLQSGFVFNPVSRNGMIYASGGTGADPAATPGQYSSFNRWEEQTLDALYTRAILGKR
jgi:CubicO group peptidase (beta-lactamase class C family)